MSTKLDEGPDLLVFLGGAGTWIQAKSWVLKVGGYCHHWLTTIKYHSPGISGVYWWEVALSACIVLVLRIPLFSGDTCSSSTVGSGVLAGGTTIIQFRAGLFLWDPDGTATGRALGFPPFNWKDGGIIGGEPKGWSGGTSWYRGGWSHESVLVPHFIRIYIWSLCKTPRFIKYCEFGTLSANGIQPNRTNPHVRSLKQSHQPRYYHHFRISYQSSPLRGESCVKVGHIVG